jgi:hypothetical protein
VGARIESGSVPSRESSPYTLSVRIDPFSDTIRQKFSGTFGDLPQEAAQETFCKGFTISHSRTCVDAMTLVAHNFRGTDNLKSVFPSSPCLSWFMPSPSIHVPAGFLPERAVHVDSL